MTLDQLIIVITAGLSYWYIHDSRKSVRLFASVCGLLGQPAWLYAAWVANQPGILLVDLFCTVGWSRGIWKNWR